MKLPDALRGITLMGIDTAPLIYLVEKHPVYFDRMVFILRYLTGGSIEGVSSMITLTEVLTQPLRMGNDALVKEYEDILQNSVGFELLPLNATIARKAAGLRAKYSLKPRMRFRSRPVLLQTVTPFSPMIRGSSASLNCVSLSWMIWNWISPIPELAFECQI